MKKKLLRSRRLLAVITAVSLLALLLVNLLLTYFGVQKTIFIDTTPEGLYTLSDEFKEECAFIDEKLGEDGKKVKITFCADPDTLLDQTVTKLVYFTALEMQNTYDNVEVETVNVVYNPTAVSKYRPTSLTTINPSDVIISYGDRYTVVNTSSFWVIAEEQLWAYNGEYKMASLVMSVTAKDRPVAYFATGHGETYYDVNAPESEGSVNTAYFYDLLTERGLEVKTIDLTTAKAIPDDCVLLIINNPTKDFIPDFDKINSLSYVSPLEVIDRYLVKEHGSVMVAKDPGVTLTNLESFLREWGFEFSDSIVKDTSSLVDTTGEYTTIVGEYDQNESSYGYMLYSEFANLSSAPSMIFSNTGYVDCIYGSGTEIPEDGSYSVTRRFEPLFYSSVEAKAYENDGNGYSLLEREDENLSLAAVCTRVELDSYTIEYKYSDLFCAASADFFSNEMLGNASYANYQIVSVLTENLIRTEEYASAALGGISINFDNVGGKELQSTALSTDATTGIDDQTGEIYIAKKGLSDKDVTSITVLVLIFPVMALIAGIVVCIRRRFL